MTDDPLLTWAAQDRRPGVRIWTRGEAAVVATPDLSRKDRLAVSGPVDDAAELLASVLPDIGHDYRPFGDEKLILALAEALPEIEYAGRFGWMDVTAPVSSGRSGSPRWLPDTTGVSELLAASFPESYAWPGGNGVVRWAGIGASSPIAVCADAWSCTDVGFLGGMAVRADARGQGLAGSVCAFATNELLTTRSRVALIVDYWNTAAFRTYEKLGFRLRPLASARRR